jgi:hypothetical protein
MRRKLAFHLILAGCAACPTVSHLLTVSHLAFTVSRRCIWRVS